MKDPRSTAAQKNEAENMLWAWHFPKTARNSGEVTAGSAEAQQIVAAGLQRGSLALFSQGLHPLQDSWSHRGIPSLEGVAGHPSTRGGALSTKTDQPWRWPVEALQAAEATFNYLSAYRTRYPQQGGNCGAATSTWPFIAGEAMSFIKLKTKADKKLWLLNRGIIMPGTYWDDVDE
jgi:hypothetical protein